MTNWKAGMSAKCVAYNWVKKEDRKFLGVKIGSKNTPIDGPEFGDTVTVLHVGTYSEGEVGLLISGYSRLGHYAACCFVPASLSFGEEVAEQIEKQITKEVSTTTV